MPAHTNTESHRQTHGQTNVGQQHSAGFSGPLSPLASRYKVYLTKWSPLFTRLGIRRGTPLPAEPAAFQCARWPRSCTGWNVQSVPPLQKAFSYARYLPASQQSLGFTLDFPVLPGHRCYYLSFPSVLEVFSFSSQGIPDKPPNVVPDVRIPEQEERRLPRQCNSQKKGSLLLTRVRAPTVRPVQWYRVREH